MQRLIQKIKAYFEKQPQIIVDIIILQIVFLSMIVVLYNKLQSLHYYPAWDQAHHLQVAIGYYESFIKLDPGIFWDMFLRSDTIYPPLFHIATALGYIVFGIRENIALIVNFPFMLLLGISTYLLGREAASRRAALASGALVFFVPLFINHWTDAMTDISSVALFITLYWLVLKTDYFRSTKWSLLTGVVCFGLILSRYAFFNAALPLVVYAVISIRKNGRTALVNLLITAMVVLPAIYWYVAHWAMIQNKLTFFGDPNNFPVKMYGLPTLFEAKNWIYFLDASVKVQGIGLVPMVLFFGSLLAHHVKRVRFGWYLLGTIISNFLVQTIWLDKIPKYVEYSYPLILILSISWITNLHKHSKMLLLILISSMVTNFVISVYRLPKETPVGQLSGDYYLLPGVRYKYERDEWPIRRIVNDIPNSPDNHPTVLILTDTETLNSVTFMYYAVLESKRIRIIPPFNIYDPAHPHSIVENDLEQFAFILTKTGGDLGIFVDYDTTYAVNKIIEESNDFILIHEYKLPDGTKALLYKNILL